MLLFFCFQSDVIHQSVFELIHTDDRTLFRSQLHFAFIPTSSQQDGAGDSPSGFSVPVSHLCLCQDEWGEKWKLKCLTICVLVRTVK